MKDNDKNFRVLAVGNTVLIRTVTQYQIGRVVALGDTWAVLEDAAWVASIGTPEVRFSAALQTGVLDEVEPVEGYVEIGLGAVVDVYHWRHPLPREPK